MTSSSVRVGPAGFSYEDWNGRVYPPAPGRGFDRLRWIARFFDLVELNVSFYRVPSAAMAAGWAAKVRAHPDFLFTAKLHRSFTHEREIRPEIVRSTRAFLEPLREAGRLGPVLAQFPWSFRPTPENLDHLRRLRDALPDLRMVVEVRHGAWGRDENLSALAALDLSPVSIDQPRIGDSLGPLANARGEVAYVRLHGRNREAWFDPKAGRDARYDYLYASDELQEWSHRIQTIAKTAREVHVVTNNHFRGQAVANALELKAQLGQPVPEAPTWLARALPPLVERLRALQVEPAWVDETDLAATGTGSAGSGTEPETGSARRRTEPETSPPPQGDLFD